MHRERHIDWERILPYLIITGLALALAINWINRRTLTTPTQLVAAVEESLSEEIRETNRQATSIMRYSDREQVFSILSTRIDHTFFLFKDEKLVYWSDHKVIPDYYSLNVQEDKTLYRSDQGQYLLLKYEFKDSYQLFGLIELWKEVPISNDYLQSGLNADVFPAREGIEIFPAENAQGLPVKYLEETVFNVDFNNAVKARYDSLGYLVVLLISLSILLLGWYMWIRLGRRSESEEFESSFFIWISFLVLLRYLMFLFEFPDAVIETGLFQSMFFAASRINPSLGDLLVNSVLLLAAVGFLFRFHLRSRFTRFLLERTGISRLLFSIFLLFLGFLALSYPHLIIQTIYENSQISLDVSESTQVNFAKVISILIFLLSGLTLFIALQVLFRLFYQLNRDDLGGFWKSLILSTAVFVLVQVLSQSHFYISLLTGIILFTLLYFTRIFKQFQHWNYKSFLYLFTVISTIGILGSYGVYEFESARKRTEMERFADYFLIKNDNLTEYLLNETGVRIQEDFFILSRLASPFLSKDVIIDKIRQVHLGSLFDKYDISIGVYKEDQLVAGDSLRNFPRTEVPQSLEQFATEYANIYFMNTANEEIAKRYVSIIPIYRKNFTVGYIALDLRLKKIIPDNVYLELLVDNRFTQPWTGQDFSYAIFEGSTVQYASGEFNYKGAFPATLLEDNSEIFTDYIVYRDFVHIGLEDSEGRIVVVGHPVYTFMKAMTTFSLFFTIQVGILLLLAVVSAAILVYRRIKMNFTTRIQLYFNLAFFIPMLIVSFVTLSSINRIFREEVAHEYNRKANNFAENIALSMENYMTGITNRDQLMNKVLEVSRYANSDVNLFNRFGELVATSRPIIYDHHLLSRYINPRAYSQIIERRNNQWITLESVGDLTYNVSYIAIRSFRSGDFIGILNVPYFESEEQLEERRVEVLSSILNIFTIVLFTFILVSYVVSRGLTFPLRLITSKLSKTNLNRVNEPINWESDDEIGLMVGEYNRMVSNLEQSKEALARSQKEMAWREIAQQVAHEIKNPLTPMKLSLQHLERQMDAGTGESSRKPIRNLLHHIDTLNDIATSFSSFAKMPIPENKPFELNRVLHETVDLHRNLENVKIRLVEAGGEVWVLGDRKLMGRIFSNLILNASQSGTENRTVHIDVTMEVGEKRVTAAVSDDGTGIHEEIQGRIFVPNFTTKEKGSGIGLSIAKHGIEHAGGKIWFETEPGKGSTFFVELQRVKRE